MSEAPLTQLPLDALAGLMAGQPKGMARKSQGGKERATGPSPVSPLALPGFGPGESLAMTATGLPEEQPTTVAPAEPSDEAVDAVVLAERLIGRPLRADEAHYLRGPITVDNRGCAWELPGWLRYAIPRARLAQVVAEAHADVREYDQMASLEEAVAVLYTAGLAVPLNSDAATVHIWTAAQVLPRYGMAESPEDVLARIYGPEEAERYADLDPHLERELLDRLRRDIRGKVVKAQKNRLREQRKR